MSRFQKVSKEQYIASTPEMSSDVSGVIYDEIVLPKRKTSGSAGYDFISPIDCVVGQLPTLIPTGIRCKLNHGSFLMIVPRSSMGFKYGMELVNTCGIIDEDYYDADNEGHIMIKISSDIPFKLNKGDSFAQGIILPYGITTDDEARAKRTGGMGSTGA